MQVNLQRCLYVCTCVIAAFFPKIIAPFDESTYTLVDNTPAQVSNVGYLRLFSISQYYGVVWCFF